MRLRDYTVTDTAKVTADFLNQVTGDFSNAMAEAFLELEGLKRRNTAFKAATRQSMSYLIQRANALSSLQTGLKITAYNQVSSSTNVQLDHTFGQLTLAETNSVTHFPTVEDNYGRFLAISSVGVYTGKTENNFAVDTTARVLVDDEGEIWSTELTPANTDGGYMWVKITTPVIGSTPNFVSVEPLSGTQVTSIKVKRQGASTQFDPATTWPVKIHQNFSDFDRDLRIKIKGVLLSNGNYSFSLRKIDLFSVTYASQGTFTYITQDAFTTVDSVVLNSPYFYPNAAQTTDMIQVQVLTLDGITVLYDSFVANQAFVVPAGPAKVQVKVTLYRVDGNTPYFQSLT